MFPSRTACRQSLLNITRRWSSTRASDPLRILFCGSDEFSIASLQALHREKQAQPDFIMSIDVVCRPPKRVGRGLKQLREVPIADVARSLRLNLHQINTFTGWQPPKPDGQPINLIVAVSFGLFVPRRILESTTYGGLNVHPSMLPDFRGSSPLHHALLHGLPRTGISVQTLDTQKFDHGVILAQTPKPGFDIPNPHEITVPELTSLVAPKGAEMLLQVIKDRHFVPPLRGVDSVDSNQEPASLRMAPRLTTEDRQIRWDTWTADEILRKERILGPLWNNIRTEPSPGLRRVVWSGGFKKIQMNSSMSQGVQQLGEPSDTSTGVLMRTCDGCDLLVEQVKLDGQPASPIVTAFKRAKVMSNNQDQPSIFQGKSWDTPR